MEDFNDYEPFEDDAEDFEADQINQEDCADAMGDWHDDAETEYWAEHMNDAW